VLAHDAVRRPPHPSGRAAPCGPSAGLWLPADGRAGAVRLHSSRHLECAGEFRVELMVMFPGAAIKRRSIRSLWVDRSADRDRVTDGASVLGFAVLNCSRTGSWVAGSHRCRSESVGGGGQRLANCRAAGASANGRWGRAVAMVVRRRFIRRVPLRGECDAWHSVWHSVPSLRRMAAQRAYLGVASWVLCCKFLEE